MIRLYWLGVMPLTFLNALLKLVLLLNPHCIFDSVHPYTKALMGAIIVPEDDVKTWQITGISGAPPNLRREIKGCRFAERCRYCGTLCSAHEGIEQTLPDGRMYRCDVACGQLKEV